jgi:hypothetical protein
VESREKGGQEDIGGTVEAEIVGEDIALVASRSRRRAECLIFERSRFPGNIGGQYVKTAEILEVVLMLRVEVGLIARGSIDFRANTMR